MVLTKLYDDMLQGPWKTTGLDVQYKLDHRGVLTFQCTTSPSDWVQNFRFWRKAYKNMDVAWYGHTGFLDLYHSVRDDGRIYYAQNEQINIDLLPYNEKIKECLQRCPIDETMELNEVIFVEKQSGPQVYFIFCPIASIHNEGELYRRN